MRENQDENINTVRNIARELDDIAEGRLYKCPECGEAVEITADENDDGETVYSCPECGAAMPEGECEPYSMYDYFENALDIEYRVNGQLEYMGVIICIACGGPHIDVDTREQRVKLYWGGDRAEWSISNDTATVIDEVFEEYYNSMR